MAWRWGGEGREERMETQGAESYGWVTLFHQNRFLIENGVFVEMRISLSL